MNIFIILLAASLDITWLVFALLSIVYSVKNWKESKININLFLMGLSFLLFIYSFNAPSSFLLNYLSESVATSINPFIFFTIGEALTIGNLLYLLVIISAFQFWVYLKDWQTFYTLPIISAIILAISLYLSPNDFAIKIFGAIGSIAFLIDAIRTRNGIEAGLGFIMWFAITCLPASTFATEVLFAFVRAVSMFIAFLGLSGLLDELFFFSKQEEEKIKNTWITKMVVKKKD